MVDANDRRLFAILPPSKASISVGSMGNLGKLQYLNTNNRNNMPNVTGRLQQAKALYDNNPYVKQAVDAGAQKIVDKVQSKTSEYFSEGPNENITMTVKPGRSNGGAGVPYLSDAPNPRETKLNTGIKLTMLQKNYTKTEENVCSPLHITCARFQFPIATTDLSYSWYSNISTRDFQTRVQESVNWAVDVQNRFSTTNIMNAMDKLFYALQVYYFYRSVDAYCWSGFNQNDGVRAIQAEFDFSTRYKVSELARQLSRTPIPPNMLEFSRYMSKCYYSGDTPGSSIIMIVPFARNTQATLTSNTNLDTVLAYFNDSTNTEVWNTLGRAMRNWIPGDPTNLLDPPIEPSYDRDFLTIFNNLPFYTAIAGNLIGPIAATSGTSFSYMSFSNNLDGIASALTDAYNGGVAYNGMVKALGASGHSRYSYYVVSGVLGFYPERTYPFLAASRLDTYTSNGTTLTASHRFGSDMVLGMTPLMQTTTVQNTIDFLLSKDLIKGRDVQRDNNPTSFKKKRRR